MKYIIKFLIVNVLMIIIIPIAAIVWLWEFNPKPLQEVMHEYRMAYARMVWKVFRINKY